MGSASLICAQETYSNDITASLKLPLYKHQQLLCSYGIGKEKERKRKGKGKEKERKRKGKGKEKERKRKGKGKERNILTSGSNDPVTISRILF